MFPWVVIGRIIPMNDCDSVTYFERHCIINFSAIEAFVTICLALQEDNNGIQEDNNGIRGNF
jgi:hypothetical protein